MENGIRPLNTDYDSLDMVECARNAKKISAYIVHKVDELVVTPPVLRSCEAKKETYTWKQPKSADERRVKHVATKRTSPRGKVPHSNAKDGPIATINYSGSAEKGPIAAKVPPSNAEVSSPKQKVSYETSKGTSPSETISPSKGRVAVKVPPSNVEVSSLSKRPHMKLANVQVQLKLSLLAKALL
ncbi:hypothetical protein Cgig2_030803 [Carnegiea gigantea]|uniref:Uncharacterized protein n=1 Tax=Carnegiea gigantea TaxID=171969 RepID=A0A9Q1QNN5_9CARY|nr:hypothetical protein Cgig2_030803 [Carnegiea gigantea]